MSNETSTLTITIPNTAAGKMIYEAVAIAIEDDEFMDDMEQVKKTAEAIIPKGTLSATFKRLQKNAKRDFLEKMDDSVPGYSAANRDQKIKDYITAKFLVYLNDQKTAKRAKRLFDLAYPVKAEAVPITEKSQGTNQEDEDVRG